MRTLISTGISAVALIGASAFALAQDKGKEKDSSPAAGAPGISRSAEPSSGGGAGSKEAMSDKPGEQGGAKAEKRSASKSEKAKTANEQPKSKDGSKKAAGPDRPAEKQVEDAQKGASKSDTKATADGSKSDSQAADQEKAKQAAEQKAKQAADQDKSDSSSGASSGESGKSDAGSLSKTQKSTDSASSGKIMALSGEKRDRVQTVFRDFREKGRIKHRANVDIDIAVGTRLPRDWDFVPVPVEIVEIVPEYRGYVVAYVEDEYVVCDPETYEVVAALPASGGSYASGGGPGNAADWCPTSLALSEENKHHIIESVQIRDEVDVSGLAIGWSVPKDITLQAFPEALTQDVIELRSCRYFVPDEQIAIVDPDDDKVVLLIDKD